MDKAGYVTPWISLTLAVESAASVVGHDDAWSQIKQAIRDSALHARGILDGVDGRLCGRWLSILAFDDHESDCLFFRPDRHANLKPPAPEIAEQVEVNAEQVEKLWPTGDKPTPNKKIGKPGRPPGTGYHKKDAPLLRKMNELILTGEANSRLQAADMVVDGAIGGGTPESKKKRLLRGYSAEYGSLKNSD